MKIFECSPPAISELQTVQERYAMQNVDNKINIFYQFFVHKNRIRNMENIECLHRNIKNPKIDKIYLLNEKIYTDEQLGFIDDYATQAPSGKIKKTAYVNGITKELIDQKLHQVNVKCRLKYSDIFQYINENEIKGYNIMINSDIFFDDSISNVKNTQIHMKRQMLSLLRFDYRITHKTLNQAQIFGPRFDSQDTWIFHSNFNITTFQKKMFNFHFGTPGCDNKMLYLMKILGYDIINDPKYIKNYHYHSEISRNYEMATIYNPWAFSMPYGYAVPEQYKPLFEHPRQKQLSFHDNERLYSYVSSKLKSKIAFIIPRISTGVILSAVHFGAILYEKYFKNNNEQSVKLTQEDEETVKMIVTKVKNNTGIIFSSINELMRFSLEYLTTFSDSEYYIDWAIQDEEYSENSTVNDFMYHNFATNKQRIWNYALEIYHYIYNLCIWTHALRGKRVLIITPYSTDVMVERTKPEIINKIYDGIELFPDCMLSFVTGPQINGKSSGVGDITTSIDDELKILYDRIKLKTQDDESTDFDIALISCGGYTNLVGDFIYKKLNRSAICFGEELFSYFGIYNEYMIKHRPDVIKLFVHKNDSWITLNKN